MESETPGLLRPKGGTKKFRENCRLLAEEGVMVAVSREGKATRFPLDGSLEAPRSMIPYLGREPFVVVDGKGSALISSPYLLWDADERAEFCKLVDIDFAANTVDPKPPPFRADGVRLEEPAWTGVVLAPLGRAFDLPVWLMLPFLPWILMFLVVRATGYFTPQRLGPAEVAFNAKAAEQAEQEVGKRRKRKASAP